MSEDINQRDPSFGNHDDIDVNIVDMSGDLEDSYSAPTMLQMHGGSHGGDSHDGHHGHGNPHHGHGNDLGGLPLN